MRLEQGLGSHVIDKMPSDFKQPHLEASLVSSVDAAPGMRWLRQAGELWCPGPFQNLPVQSVLQLPQ